MTALPKQRPDTGATAPSAAPSRSKAQAPAMAATPSRWTDTGFWRRWAVRLLGIWLLLSLGMVAQRIATADIRPALLDAREAHEELVAQRDTLSLEVQSLNSAGRIQQWAEEAGMVRFADSLKRAAPFEARPLPVPQQSAEPAPALRLNLDLNGSAGADSATEPNQP